MLIGVTKIKVTVLKIVTKIKVTIKVTKMWGIAIKVQK